MSAPHHPKPGKRPSRWQLKQMAMDGVMSTTDGCRILDLYGHCEHGAESWLTIMRGSGSETGYTGCDPGLPLADGRFSVLSPSPEAQETRAAGEERA